jgi:hypothetical protein
MPFLARLEIQVMVSMSIDPPGWRSLAILDKIGNEWVII